MRPITREEQRALTLLHDIEKRSKMNRHKISGFITPFKVGYLAVLAFVLSKIKAVTFNTRESIISELSSFGDCRNDEIESFITGEDSLRKKVWVERIDAKLEILRRSKSKAKRHLKLARVIFDTPIFHRAEFNEFLSSYRARDHFASGLEEIFARDGSGILYLLDLGSYEFWFGELVIEDIEASEVKRNELKKIRALQKKSELNAKVLATQKIVTEAPSFISNDCLFLSPDDMELLAHYHKTHCPGITFDPKFVITSLALSAKLDPSKTFTELQQGGITVLQILDKLKSSE